MTQYYYATCITIHLFAKISGYNKLRTRNRPLLFYFLKDREKEWTRPCPCSWSMAVMKFIVYTNQISQKQLNFYMNKTKTPWNRTFSASSLPLSHHSRFLYFTPNTLCYVPFHSRVIYGRKVFSMFWVFTHVISKLHISHSWRRHVILLPLPYHHATLIILVWRSWMFFECMSHIILTIEYIVVSECHLSNLLLKAWFNEF